MRQMKLIIAALLVTAPFAANADLIQITAGSDTAGGELGYFVADTDVLVANSGSMQASDFFTFFFSDPISGITLDTTNVDGDTGFTYFGIVAGIWTVDGGGADSLTDSDLGHAVWIAGSSYLSFNSGASPAYGDVVWTTSAYSVPEPGTLALFGIGLFGMGFARRNKKV